MTLDLSKITVPNCITCGTHPTVTQKESKVKTAEDNYKEWKPSGHFVLMVECPVCGRFIQTYAMSQEYIDQHPDVIKEFGWTEKYHHFIGCQAPDYDSDEDEDELSGGCEDNEGFVCEECPHWGYTHCEKCGCSDFEFLRRCTPEDDSKHYHQKSMWKCAKCGNPIRVWDN